MAFLTSINKMGGVKSTPRQSNIELLRIIAMLLVLIVHTDFFSIGIINSHSEVTDQPLQSFVRIEIEGLALICVNLFVIISGYFGIRPKLKNVLNLVFQIVFWRTVIGIAAYGTGHASLGAIIMTFIPGSYPGDWFVPCYLLLLLIAPALNAYIEKNDKTTLLRFLITFYILQTIFGWLLHFWPYNNGYSLISFIGLYVLGRYINLHLSDGIRRAITPTRGISGYLLLSTIAATTVFAFLRIVDHDHLDDLCMVAFMRYSSPVNVICTVLMLLAFTRMSFSSRFINHLAKSAFVVYIIHLNPFVVDYYIEAARWIYGHFSIGGYAVGVVVWAVAVYLACAAADQVRIWLWRAIARRIPA